MKREYFQIILFFPERTSAFIHSTLTGMRPIAGLPQGPRLKTTWHLPTHIQGGRPKSERIVEIM